MSQLEKIDNAYIQHLHQPQQQDMNLDWFISNNVSQPQSINMLSTQLQSQDPDGLHETQLKSM